MASALKNRSTGVEMSGDTIEERPLPSYRKLTTAEKQRDHVNRIKRTLVGSLLGILAGVISFLVVHGPENILGLQSYTILALFIMLAGVVVQRHIFVLLKITTPELGKKDWLYQGFITFAFWFISWTLLLTAYTP
jgi:hypothetical protein